jgi:carbon monoxide dehydrogenase subunit G
MPLQLNDDHTVSLRRKQVWCLLNDPEVLQEVNSGCEKLVRVGEDKYELELVLLVGSVIGNYKGSVELSEKKPLDYYAQALVGEGSIGFMKDGAHCALVEKGSDTIISYEGQPEVNNLVAGAGNRVLGGVAKFMAKPFFKVFDDYIKDHDMSRFTLAYAAQSSVDAGGAS